jgi:hypothetical protein
LQSMTTRKGMPQELSQPSRPWRQIAKDLVHETDAQRTSELSHELSRALQEQLHASAEVAPTVTPFSRKAPVPTQLPKTISTIFRTQPPQQHVCPICKEPINLRATVTDGVGRAVHAECFWDKIKRKVRPKTPENNPSKSGT